MPSGRKHQSHLPANRRYKGLLDIGLTANFIDAQHVRKHQSIRQHMHKVPDANKFGGRKVLNLVGDGGPIAFGGSKQRTKRGEYGVDDTLSFLAKKSRGVQRGANYPSRRSVPA